jgi:hypothetical protein
MDPFASFEPTPQDIADEEAPLVTPYLMEHLQKRFGEKAQLAVMMEAGIDELQVAAGTAIGMSIVLKYLNSLVKAR